MVLLRKSKLVMRQSVSNDAIQPAFAASDIQLSLVGNLRKKYSTYCETYSGKKSAISMTDSLLRASEFLFKRIEHDIPRGTLDAHSVILELRRLQSAIAGNMQYSELQSRRLSKWLKNYIEKNLDKLECNDVLAIGGLALALPIPDHDLAEAFSPIWLSGKETDTTKVSIAVVASMYHSRDQVKARRDEYLKCLESALQNQPWNRMGTTKGLVVAGFAAGYAIMGDHILCSARLSGPIRAKGLPYSDGFSVLLLSFEANNDTSKANLFIHNKEYLCQDIDPVTAFYLNARGIHCPSQAYGGTVRENLNRQALFALWSGNNLYYSFVERVAIRVSDNPPLFEVSTEALRTTFSRLVQT